MNSTLEKEVCPEATEEEIQDPLSCPPVNDGFLCWPKTSAGTWIELNCPKGVPGLDAQAMVERHCLPSGKWFSCNNATTNYKGWTNYTSCWTEPTRKIMDSLNYDVNMCPEEGESGSWCADDSECKILIAKISRVMEVCGYSFSLLVLFFASVTFCYFRKLRKHKVTRIHMNLFASMILQSLIRLVIYINQFVVREDGFTGSESEREGIDNTPYLCQTFYTLIEYGKTAMFLWMFIEGLILHHMTSVAFSRGPDNQKKFYFSGWLIPIPLVVVWAVANMLDPDSDPSHCGQGYSLLATYWILEGPRIFVIVLNIFILLNVTRVLFTHLSGNEDSDIKQIRKSLKSLLFLLPLLGITNILHHLWPNPLGGSWVSFAVWSLTTHFLYSFQGVFVACVYFFFDQKVKTTLYTFWILKVTLRDRANSASINAAANHQLSGHYPVAPQHQVRPPPPSHNTSHTNLRHTANVAITVNPTSASANDLELIAVEAFENAGAGGGSPGGVTPKSTALVKHRKASALLRTAPSFDSSRLTNGVSNGNTKKRWKSMGILRQLNLGDGDKNKKQLRNTFRPAASQVV